MLCDWCNEALALDEWQGHCSETCLEEARDSEERWDDWAARENDELWAGLDED